MKTTINNCEYCNKEFVAKRSDAKFCSPSCKQSAYLERIKLQKEQLEADALWEQDEFTANKLREQAVLAAKRKEIEELEKANDVKEKLAIEESSKAMKELFKEYEDDIIRGKIDDANKILKDWLQQLLVFAQEEETSLYKAKSLFEKIIKSGSSYTFSNIPNDYKYLSFINHTLIPKAKNLYDAIQYSRERYVSIDLSTELNKKFTDILYEID